MADSTFHESSEALRPETREMHRAIASLIEELEAVDWYNQRIDATEDADLARILTHNRDEEKEHAVMMLEWIRRRDPKFDEQLKNLLFQAGPIAGGEHSEPRDPTASSLAIGSLREPRRAPEEATQ